jgi:ADP-ribose pyrophosphatase YjhB (NUDIX family)
MVCNTPPLRCVLMEVSRYTTGYSIGVGAVVCFRERVLLVRGLTANGPGYWHLPGGYVELDESMEEAVTREVMEEAGIACEVQGIVSVRHKLYRNADSKNVEENSIYVVFQLKPTNYDDAMPKADGVETCDAKFFTLQELESLTDCLTIFRELACTALKNSLNKLAPVELINQKGARYTIYR